jgi:hypothetical protein
VVICRETGRLGAKVGTGGLDPSQHIIWNRVVVAGRDVHRSAFHGTVEVYRPGAWFSVVESCSVPKITDLRTDEVAIL